MENAVPARTPMSSPRATEPRGRGELTSRQAAIVRCITEVIARQGYPPTMREIGQVVKLASTVLGRPPADGPRAQGRPLP